MLSQPTTSYQKRRAIAGASAGKVLTHEAFTVGEPPKTGLKAWLDEPGNWAPERRSLHDRLVEQALVDARKFTEAVGGDDTIYAMRGNTAAGKTRAIKGNIPELEAAVEATKDAPHRALNPDNFKHDLLAHDSDLGLTHFQVHNESTA